MRRWVGCAVGLPFGTQAHQASRCRCSAQSNSFLMHAAVLTPDGYCRTFANFGSLDLST